MQLTRLKIVLIAVLLGAVTGGPCVFAKDPILVRFEPYPPFVWADAQGTIDGQFAKKTQQIMVAAGLSIRWQQGSYKRIMRDLYGNRGQFCVTGYGFSPERANLVRYSLSYGRFPPGGIAVRSANVAMFQYHKHIYDVLADPTISGAFIEGASYGAEFNRRVARGEGRHIHIAGGDEDLVTLLIKGRVHFAMVNGVQLDHFKTYLDGADTLTTLYPSGMSKGAEVHVICTLNMPEGIIGQVNAAIQAIGRMDQE